MKRIQIHRLEDLILWSILTKAIYKYNTVSSHQNPNVAFFFGNGKIHPKIQWSPSNQNYFKKEQRRLTLPDFKTIQRRINQDSVTVVYKDKYTNERLGNTGINPCMDGSLFSTRMSRPLNRKRSVFNKRCWEKWVSTCKTIRSARPSPYSTCKNKDVNCKA